MIKSSGRLSITLGFIAASVVWIAHGIGLLPNPNESIIRGRLRLSETIALTTTAYAERGNILGLKPFLERVRTRNSNIMSIGVRQKDRLVLSIGEHEIEWRKNNTVKQSQSTPTHMNIGILANGNEWGHVEIRYQKLRASGVWGFIQFPMILVLFTGSLVTLISWIFLSRSLKYLNPSKVVPARVRLALDSLAEGLVLLDKEQQIVLANESFTEIVGRSSDDLLGESPDIFDWESTDNGPSKRMPWQQCFDDVAPQRGNMLTLIDNVQEKRIFIVNATPIIESNGGCKGVLTSFDDVTLLEDKRAELCHMLEILRASRDEIRRQNENLQFLASRDSLTGCYNRRAFFDAFGKLWESPKVEFINVIMIDIDHFKSINDNYGHGVGDLVIKGAAIIILEIVGDQGTVCRYGGEEFCVLLPDMEFDKAVEVGESIRAKAEAQTIEDVGVTFSVGVSARRFGAMDPQHLLEQSDQSLYAAKNAGRNKVVRWDQCNQEELPFETEVGTDYGDTINIIQPVAHASSVAALYTALFYKDTSTALHSARVANLSSCMASKLGDDQLAKVLEVAGIFHDLGKIGIPDNVLRKPTSLSDLQKRLMQHRHDIGEAISRSADVSPDVAEIVKNYQVPFDNGQGFAELEQDQPRIATACRILAICDAFDSMVHEAQYRNAKSQCDAVKEIRNCSPSQFDPALVDVLEQLVEEQPSALLPLRVEGVHIDNSEDVPKIDVMSAAQMGDIGPLRAMMKRLKRDSLSESPEIQNAVEQLDQSLAKNDTELKRLIETTQEIMDLCNLNRSSTDTENLSSLFKY